MVHRSVCLLFVFLFKFLIISLIFWSFSCSILNLSLSVLSTPTMASVDFNSGIRDTASALELMRPALKIISKSYSCNFKIHLAILPFGCFWLYNHVIELLSVKTLNFLPYKYTLKCLIPEITANASNSFTE